MTFQRSAAEIDPPIFLSTWSSAGLGLGRYAAVATSGPASNAFAAAARAYYSPIRVTKPYALSRFWWLNGATVGTDSFMTAIYEGLPTGPGGVVAASALTLSAGTVSQLQFVTPAVQAHVITSGSSTTDGTSFATGSVTLYARPGYMYALCFANTKASAAQAASTVQTTTGGTIAFTSRNSQTYGASTEGRVSMWTAVPTSDVTDTITIDFGGGNTQTGCAWALIGFTNVDTATNHGVVQSVVGSGNSTTPLATLAAFGSANNATFMVQGNLSSAQTAGTGFRELTDTTYATPSNFLGTNFRSDNDTSADATITSGQWGAIGAEVKSLGTSWTLAAGAYWLALWGSGTTATVYRTSSIPLASGYLESSLTAGLPLVPTPATKTASPILYVHGITSRVSP